MFSLRTQAGRMAFLLQLCAGTISRNDVEAIAVQESGRFNKRRPVMVDNIAYKSITEAAGVEVMFARTNGTIKYNTKIATEHHRAVNRMHKEIVRKIEAGVPGYQYL